MANLGFFRSFTFAIAGCILLAGFSSAQTVKQSGKKSAGADSKIEDEGKQEKGLRFAVLGDWGWNGKRNQTEVAKVMVAKGVGKFIVSVGDNFQVNGVRSVSDPLWMLSYENVFNDPALECDWYCALGNHDYHGNPQAEIDYTKVSRRWNMPARYFAVHKQIDSATAADFYIIDTSPLQSSYRGPKEEDVRIDGQDAAKQMKWIDSCLTNSKSRWKLVFGHHPVYSSGSAHGKQTGDMQSTFAGLFERTGVDVYFCGHDHDFEHCKPKSGHVNYFVCGTVEVRPMGDPIPETVFAASVPGYTKVRLSRNEMAVTMIDTAGNQVYTTDIKK